MRKVSKFALIRYAMSQRQLSVNVTCIIISPEYLSYFVWSLLITREIIRPLLIRFLDVPRAIKFQRKEGEFFCFSYETFNSLSYILHMHRKMCRDACISESCHRWLKKIKIKKNGRIILRVSKIRGNVKSFTIFTTCLEKNVRQRRHGNLFLLSSLIKKPQIKIFYSSRGARNQKWKRAFLTSPAWNCTSWWAVEKKRNARFRDK